MSNHHPNKVMTNIIKKSGYEGFFVAKKEL